MLYRIHESDAAVIDAHNFLEVLKKAVQVANKSLQHSDCNIVVYADPDQCIPEEGTGGRAWGNDWIRLDVDPHSTIGIRKAITTYVPGMVAHELHHTRRAKTVGYGEALGEALVTEGLAQAYQEFLYPDVEVLYAHHLTTDEISSVWRTAQEELTSGSYDHAAWFFGKGKLKRWAGYSLGYDMVRSYMKKIGEQNPAKLVDTPAEDFLQDYA